MDIPQPKKVQQQAPTTEEVQNIVKLQRSIVKADILKTKPEMSDPAKYNAALKEATTLALQTSTTLSATAKSKPRLLWDGEPESLAYECYVMGRRDRDKEAQDDQQVAAGDSEEDSEDGPFVDVPVKQSTSYVIAVEVDGGREVANPLALGIMQYVRNFGRGSHIVSKQPGPSYKKKVEKPAPVQQSSSSRPAKRARY
ncbi:hypothetical protein N0V85_002693 [Neurospora sp. IMI 360204]|nr:hypothetical protein N0V85_002693 [Neurospora sp. IMI 360204]